MTFEEFISVFQAFGYLFVIVASIGAMIASANVDRTFKRYEKTGSVRGLTGAEAARQVLLANGVSGVNIARTSGKLTDHFNPKDNTIYLSDAVHDSVGISAIGVAAHEAGHAVQHAVGYFPIRVRSAIVPAVNFGSRLAMPLILVGLMLSAASNAIGYEIAMIGVIAYSLCVIFQLVTLPTEYNASSRAMEALENSSILSGDELTGARKTLNAAALTYVAALAVSLMQFLRLLSIVMGGRRRR